MAIAISFFINNLMRYIFLLKKYGMQPITFRATIVIAAFVVAYFVGHLLPDLLLVWDILLKGSVFAVIFLAIVFKFKISDDLNTTVAKIVSQIKRFDWWS